LAESVTWVICVAAILGFLIDKREKETNLIEGHIRNIPTI
jgi:hypothetical protein